MEGVGKNQRKKMRLRLKKEREQEREEEFLASSSDSVSAISEEDLEELMNRIKEDPYLKPIVEEIEIGGPIVMMMYLNNPEVLLKLGKAMGFVDSDGEYKVAAVADYIEDKEPPHLWC
ncbi:hypothetical protein MKW98_020097 [Papaver atlanticum]|uniref:Uncharacterized protein n=1 Tax=Papaver atlanticum TaxID=357466 RepID=A0AAD4S1B4_9MAGN|nr:hypothetical protein MKW98_020097 [Papaver atlanticum]